MKLLNPSILTLSLLIIAMFSFAQPKSNVNEFSEDTAQYYIIIDKSDFELRVYDQEGWYATYPVVFGSKDPGDKMIQGDKKTPNGTYSVLLKKINKKWGKELLLDYPLP